METVEITWREYREKIISHIEERKGSQLCRGQANSEWNLKTSFHRQNLRQINFHQYFNILIPHLSDCIGTLENREIDVSNAVVNGSFLAYAQHHGLPTPLLDWTFSPYKAAYYAFSEVEDVNPKSNKVAIYIFDHEKWISTFKQINDFTVNEAHVSFLPARSMGNHRQLFQQGTYLFTNVEDVEGHIELNEKERKDMYLQKFIFSVKEKPTVMSELESMGINAYSLFGGSDGMFRFFKESIFRSEVVGETPEERMQKFLEYLGKERE
jgi:hypothetical protein